MNPLDYLQEALNGVERALDETLRHDYGPDRSNEYYRECKSRIAEIKKAIVGLPPGDPLTLAILLHEAEQLALWIALFERSHLGEFSWPFAEEITRIATAFLSETTLSGDVLQPIIHIVSEGGGYRIRNEGQVPASSGKQRFAVVYFPPHLKYHVLLHALFGHELGHTAIHTTTVGALIARDVSPSLVNSSPLASSHDLDRWLSAADAPAEIKSVLARYRASSGRAYSFPADALLSWQVEFICDLFGLVLFGPAFVAAHKTVLEPAHPYPFLFKLSDPTHPPYAVRHKVLMQALRLLAWDKPVIPAGGEFHDAEAALYTTIMTDPFPTWAAIFPDSNVQAAIAGIQSILSPRHLGYTQPTSDTVQRLVHRLVKSLPPLDETLTEEGEPRLAAVQMAHVLYGGWIYWLGQSTLPLSNSLSFFYTNRLCNQALIQQTAINHVLASRKTP